MKFSPLGENAQPNETKRIRRICRIYSGYLNKNSFPNTLNEIKRYGRMRRMKLSAWGDKGK
jgi:hypothetical protein